MTSVRMVGTYLILFMATAGLLGLLYFGRSTEDQVWAALFLIIGALVRDAASIQSAQSSKDITAAANQNQPTITTTSGPPAKTMVTPPRPDEGDFRDTAHNP